jgi:hypothetical protein
MDDELSLFFESFIDESKIKDYNELLERDKLFYEAEKRKLNATSVKKKENPFKDVIEKITSYGYPICITKDCYLPAYYANYGTEIPAYCTCHKGKGMINVSYFINQKKRKRVF